jgi:hypothetical protein
MGIRHGGPVDRFAGEKLGLEFLCGAGIDCGHFLLFNRNVRRKCLCVYRERGVASKMNSTQGCRER